MSRTFEMSASGPLVQDAVVECGVCWWTYDPAEGAPEHDLLPGIAFAQLPGTFRCPQCDAPKDKFMLKPGQITVGADAAPPAPTADLADRLTALEAAYTKAEDAMVGLPVHNPRLNIEMIGFRETVDGYVGVAITPWSMNIALLPLDPATPPAGAIGSSRDIAFPSGTYSFLAGRLDGFGALETCNLISPMDEFDDPKIARLTAEAALEGLFTPVEPIEHAKTSKAAREPEPSRRAFLGGGRRTQGEVAAE